MAQKHDVPSNVNGITYTTIENGIANRGYPFIYATRAANPNIIV